MADMFNSNNVIAFFLSSYVILFQVSPSLSESDGRIVGGVSTTIEAVPYLVQLRSNDFIFCSGTLVQKYYVISAAHCFDKKPLRLTVVGGASKSYNDESKAVSKISYYIIPKQYNNETYDMDIAIIKLKTPLVGGKIKTISMDCNTTKEGAVVELFGWGRRIEGENSIPIQLQTVKVNTIEQGWCKMKYWKRRKITYTMFCAYAEGKDSCNGDSGGPAMINKQFCGVVSWGRGCADRDSPGVYTNLTTVATFVNRAMKRLEKL